MCKAFRLWKCPSLTPSHTRKLPKVQETTRYQNTVWPQVGRELMSPDWERTWFNQCAYLALDLSKHGRNLLIWPKTNVEVCCFMLWQGLMTIATESAMSNLQPTACMKPSPSGRASIPPALCHHGSDSSHWVAWPRPSASTEPWCAVSPIWAETRARGTAWCELKSWPVRLCTLIHWLNTVLSTAKNMLPRQRNLWIGLKKNHQIFGLFATSFSVNINILMECIKLQSKIWLDFYNPSLTREKYPWLRSHALLLLSLLVSTYVCEQPFWRMKYTKSKISSEISHEHLESSLRIAATAIEPEWCTVVASQPNVVSVKAKEQTHLYTKLHLTTQQASLDPYQHKTRDSVPSHQEYKAGPLH